MAAVGFWHQSRQVAQGSTKAQICALLDHCHPSVAFSFIATSPANSLAFSLAFAKLLT